VDVERERVLVGRFLQHMVQARHCRTRLPSAKSVWIFTRTPGLSPIYFSRSSIVQVPATRRSAGSSSCRPASQFVTGTKLI
jgi:hypothetical protein